MTLRTELPAKPVRAQFGNVPQDFIRVQPIMHVGGLLRELGASPDDVFAAAELSADLFVVPENTISFGQLKNLMRLAVSATGCDHFGLLLGATALSNPLGLLGEVLQHCTNVGTAIAYFQQYFHLHDRIGIATRNVDGQIGSIGYLLFEGNSAEERYSASRHSSNANTLPCILISATFCNQSRVRMPPSLRCCPKKSEQWRAVMT